MKNENIILIAAGIIGFSLFSKTTMGATAQNAIGEGIGNATGQIVTGAAQGIGNTTTSFFNGLWNYGYNFGMNNAWTGYLFTPTLPITLWNDLSEWWN